MTDEPTPYPTLVEPVPVAGNDSGPIPKALQKVVQESDLTLESTCGDMFRSAESADPSSTGLRMIGFSQTKCAMVFSGPEAEILAYQFVRYAEALMETLTRQADASDRAAEKAAGQGDPRGALASIGIRRP